ncbi:MAG: hypothetical protein E7504_04305 [Ruminococcus sp.]|nr:hypothetical protein [Ruminococcus sp.]
MSKLISGYNYKKVSFGSEGYKDLSGFVELQADTDRKGELRIIDNGGSWKVGASKTLYSALGEPGFVKVLMSDTQVAIKVVPEGTAGAYEFCKGAIIYSTSLAETIMRIASGTEFKPNTTTRCGRIDAVQTDEDGSTTVLLSFD